MRALWMAVVAALLVAPVPAAADTSATAEGTAAQTVGHVVLDRPEDDSYLPGYESVHDQALLYFFDGGLPPDLAVWQARVTSDSDPVGILVPAVREARNSSLYTGSFTFTDTASDPLTQRLSVADGDRLRLVYRDTTGREHTSSARWVSRSRRPDVREIVHLRPEVSRVVVEGAAGAVTASAEVLLYTTQDAVAPVAVSTADADGRFVVEAQLADPPATVWVSARAPGLEESVRVWEDRAWIAGRAVSPESGPPPYSTWVDAWHETQADPCGGRVDCRSGHVANSDGRWAAVGPVGPAGSYRILAHPWGTEFGNSAERTVHGDGTTTTIDAGTSVLAPPNFHGRAVTTAGLPVPEVTVESFSDDGHSANVAISGRDGRLRLHFGPKVRHDWGEGDFDFRVWTPFGCSYEPVPNFVVSARGGQPTPATIQLVLRPLDEGEVDRVPLAPFASGDRAVATVDLGSGTVRLTFDGVDPDGMLTVSQGCVTPELPDGISLLDPPVDLSLDGSEFDEAEVCLPYTEERRVELDAAHDELQILHMDKGRIEALPTAVDPTDQTACATTTSFSAFAVAAVTEAQHAKTACPADRVPDSRLADVASTSVHKPAIDCAVWRRIAYGTSATTYAPHTNVSRGQMASFLTRLLNAAGVPLPAAPADHFDDDNGSVHELAINQLAELGITKGSRTPRRYAPAEAVDRAQMASFLMRTYEHVAGAPAAPAPDRFTDDNGNIHEPRINQAAAHGFAQGLDHNRYGPSLPTRRDQMASFLIRLLEALTQQGLAAEPGP